MAYSQTGVVVAQKLNVVLCWHMHQPWYPVDGEIPKPWVYLHAIKDYADMAAHLETVPGARAVVNFVPVLLEQVDRYREEISAFLEGGSRLSDPLLAHLAGEALPQEVSLRRDLLNRCLDVDSRHVLERFPAFGALKQLAEAGDTRYLSDQFFWDVLVWYHLAWVGEHAKRHDPLIGNLIAKAGHYSLHDRRELLRFIGDTIAGLLPRYRALADSGSVELSMSPWSHPIVPLLLDLSSGREALPHLPTPVARSYPGGEERVRWHFELGMASFEHHLGVRPKGCWPPEGAISAATLDLLSELDFQWCASGQGVLTNSLAAGGQTVACTHVPFAQANQDTVCFFRDDGLSDLIGFTYKDWDADDAVANLIAHLETTARHCAREDAVVTIIMDGENAWEHYPENGYQFLQALYGRLVGHPFLSLVTPGAYLARYPGAAIVLDRVVAGSWVHGALNTWIGAPDKNRAWDLLVEAKLRLDASPLKGDARAECERLLGICEGSDWFWWLGDDQARLVVSEFESLYRAHLMAVFNALGELPPAELASVLSRGSSQAAAATMRRGS